MSAWDTVALGRVCKVVPGFAFKSKDWCSEGLPVLKIKNIRGDGAIDTAEVDCVPQNLMSERMKRFVLKDGDILLAMTGATAGKVGKLRDPSHYLLNQRVAKLEPIDIDPVFFWSVVSSAEYQNRFFRLADGAAQPNMSGSQIEGVPVPLPPLETQRRIASILGAYDDLIEVNRRRVALLEGMARGLFEEWFVRFRFPGHEAVPMVDTPNGPLPEGWSLQGLGELGTLRSGSGKLTKAAYLADGVRAYSASGPDGFVEQAECSGPAVIVSAVGAYCGRTWLAEGDWTCIANTFAVIPNQGVPAEFLYLGTLGYEKWPRRGAAQPFIAKADARTIVLPQPTRDVWDSFCGLARPTLKLVELLSETNKSLATSRDLLLPRLISGQLSVTTAERELEDAA